MVIYKLSPLPPISPTIGDVELLEVRKLWYFLKSRMTLQFMLTDHVSIALHCLAVISWYIAQYANIQQYITQPTTIWRCIAY